MGSGIGDISGTVARAMCLEFGGYGQRHENGWTVCPLSSMPPLGSFLQWDHDFYTSYLGPHDSLTSKGDTQTRKSASVSMDPQEPVTSRAVSTPSNRFVDSCHPTVSHVALPL